MKTFIYRVLISVVMIFLAQESALAYVTCPSTSYSLSVGVDKYLPVPDAYYGYIDNAVWACSQAEISFIEKDAAGAIIQITRSFSGTAIVEVLATEKYLDSYGYTRSITYYKQYLITCIGGDDSNDTSSEIILPESIELSLGETKHYEVLSGNCYNGAFSLHWKERNPTNCITFSVNYNTGNIAISGLMVGNGILQIKTANGDEKECKITVTAPEATNNRRTEAVAITDIKLLINNVLSIFDDTNVKVVPADYNKTDIPNNIYNIQGILIKRNATPEDVKALNPGIYIIKGEKVIVR